MGQNKFELIVLIPKIVINGPVAHAPISSRMVNDPSQNKFLSKHVGDVAVLETI